MIHLPFTYADSFACHNCYGHKGVFVLTCVRSRGLVQFCSFFERSFPHFIFYLSIPSLTTIRFSGRAAALCAWINDRELLAFSSVLQSHRSPSPGSQGYALLGSSCTRLPWAQHPAGPAAAGRAFPVPK